MDSLAAERGRYVATKVGERMGLDIVEMVIELEKEFAIDLPDGALRLAETVGDLFAAWPWLAQVASLVT